MAVGRFDVYLVSLDPTVGSEIKKTLGSSVRCSRRREVAWQAAGPYFGSCALISA